MPEGVRTVHPLPTPVRRSLGPARDARQRSFWCSPLLKTRDQDRTKSLSTAVATVTGYCDRNPSAPIVICE